ncbi:MAG: tetratricopeptide repeat protein [Myxococcales bacterium]|nr:tetratricopeptide repeat protein [Myxococcales bacterium]
MPGSWRNPLQRLRGSTRATPGALDAAYRRALVSVLDRDYDAAEQDLRAIVEADSGQIEAYLALARVYRQRGEIGRAIRLHQNLVLRTDVGAPWRGLALRGLAEDFRGGGFLERSVAAYEEVVRESPDDEESRDALVQLLCEARSPERALELLPRRWRGGDRALEGRLWLQAAEIAHQEGRADDARKAIRRSLKRDPDAAKAWILAGELEAERGRSKRALERWRKAADLDRRGAAGLYPRIQSGFAATEDSRGFETFLRARLDDSPDDFAARLALARALSERGELDGAVGELKRILDLDPEQPEALAELGRAQAAAGLDAEAAETFRRLIDVAERRGWFRAREWAVE